MVPPVSRRVFLAGAAGTLAVACSSGDDASPSAVTTTSPSGSTTPPTSTARRQRRQPWFRRPRPLSPAIRSPWGWHRASRCPTASCCGPVSRLTRPTRGRNARRALRRPDEPSVRPPDFDLKVKWEAIAANIAELRGEQIISALAEPQAISWLHAQFGKDRVSVDTASADPNGRLRVEITFPTTHTPVAEPAGLAAFVKVLEPADLRTELHSLGQKLVAQYEF